MGNYVRTTITIGGRLNACCVPAFLDELEERGLGVCGIDPAGGEADLPADATELAEALLLLAEHARKDGRAEEGVTCSAEEINYGNLDDLKAFCRARGLRYHYDCAEGNGEFDAEDEWWTPEQGFAVLSSLVCGGSAVPLHDLRNAWKDKTAAEILAWYDARTLEPGPLSVDPAPAAACPGCLAEALAPGTALPTDFTPADSVGDPEAA